MPLSVDDRINLIRVKIERAKKHLLDLETEVLRFRDKKVNIAFSDQQPAPGKFRSKPGMGRPSVTSVRTLSFNAVCAAGDVVQNLRSALDYLANHLVAAAGNPPSRRVEFPIAKDPAAYERDKAGKVEGMVSEAVKAIDRLKPYKGGNTLLWKIHELNNIDKHRMLFTVDKDCAMFDDWLPSGGYTIRTGNPTFPSVFDDEVEEDVEFEIDEAFNKSEIAKGDALLPTLHQMVDYVESIIVSFKQFLG